MRYKRKGRRSSGYGQRQVIEEDYAIAVKEFGKRFVDPHMDAFREGRTKVRLRDLVKRAQRERGR